METYMYNKGKQFENQFFIYEPKCLKNVYFGLFSQIRKQSDNQFLSLNPKYEQIYTFFHIWGVLGGAYVEPRWTKISGQYDLITEQTYV